MGGHAVTNGVSLLHNRNPSLSLYINKRSNQEKNKQRITSIRFDIQSRLIITKCVSPVTIFTDNWSTWKERRYRNQIESHDTLNGDKSTLGATKENWKW